MSEKHMNKPLETDWSRIDAMTDDEIDTSDIAPLNERFFQRARIRLPNQAGKIGVIIQIDPEVLAWFQSQGKDYEQRINVALRLYAEIHKAA